MISERRQEAELYLHIPFCLSKCAYCDFLSAPASAEIQERYVAALCEELQERRQEAEEHSIRSVFIGGGTPSLLSPMQLQKIMETLSSSYRLCPDAEITIEANPGTVTSEKLHAYKSAGINRISFGCQSAQDEELKALGRIHTWGMFRESYFRARAAGFDNINVDLMSGLPGQSLHSWHQSLRSVATLEGTGPEHLSCYSLILEEGTPFYERRNELNLPDEDTERRMYSDTKDLLQSFGYHRYEISNYAKRGGECRHNIGYWTGIPYLGFGIGASSFWNGIRWHNGRGLTQYLQIKNKEERHSFRVIDEVLSFEDREADFMITGLRLTKGISKQTFRKRFQRDLEEVYGSVLEKYRSAGLLEDRVGRVALTDQGISLSNLVLADFLPDKP